MKYFAHLTDGSKLEIAKYDYTALNRMVARNVENGVTLASGDVLKSKHVMRIYIELTADEQKAKEEKAKAAVPAEPKKVSERPAPAPRVATKK